MQGQNNAAAPLLEQVAPQQPASSTAVALGVTAVIGGALLGAVTANAVQHGGGVAEDNQSPGLTVLGMAVGACATALVCYGVSKLKAKFGNSNVPAADNV